MKLLGKHITPGILFLGLIFLAGCGGGSSGNNGNPGTIQGTVTATSSVSFKPSPVGLQAAASGIVGVPGAVCTLGGTDKSITTDQNGFFQMTDVATGSYNLICKKTAADGKVYAFLRIVEVQNSQTVNLDTVEITETGSISGNATLADQTDHTGISVYIPGTSFQAMTDAVGAYLMSNVPEGTYELRFEKTGYATAALNGINVTAGQTTIVVDMALNLSTGATGSLSIENGAAYAASQTVTVWITASADATLMQISENINFLGETWKPVSSTTSWTFASDGEKWLYIKFANANGLESSPVGDSIIIDTMPPTNGSVIINGGASATNSPNVILTLSAEDATTTAAQMMISNEPNFADAVYEPFTPIRSWSLTVGNGTKTVYAKFKDQAGNEIAQAASASIILDTALIPEIAAIATGGYHTCALNGSGGVKCWGYNAYGQLGDGSTANRDKPVDVVGLSNGVKAISAGLFHTCVVTEADGVKCWGRNNLDGFISENGDKIGGQLGDGTTTNRTTPVDVVGLSSGIIGIAAGGFHTCALTTLGGVKCWGHDDDGQIGDGHSGYGIDDRLTPSDVVGLSGGVSAITVGGVHTCALDHSGGVKCWGANYWGQIGEGGSSNTPVDISGLSSGVISIEAGYRHTCVVMTSGGVKCWGYNDLNELGDGTRTTRLTPVDVIGLSSVVTAVTGGGSHTCALTTSGSVKCWGYNLYGQIGDGGGDTRSSPVDVVDLSDGIIAIDAGDGHTCALTVSGEVKCWGDSSFGQVGDGSFGNRYSPVNVVGLF